MLTMRRYTHAAACFFLMVLTTNGHAAALQGSEWQPLQIADEAVPEDSGVFVRFHSKQRLIGHSGCNRMFAEYQASDGHIFVGPVAATRMACDEAIMAREAALALALESARTYHRDGTSLVVFDSAGQPILEMRQTDWD